MKRLPLPTRERLREMFDYFPLTGVLRWRIRPELGAPWNARYSGREAGRLTKASQLVVGIDRLKYPGARIIWKWLHDEEPYDVDHEDLGRSNNRETNLRAATASQNASNRPLWASKELPKGVSWHKGAQKFTARITINRRIINLGCFDDAQSAHAAYRLKAIELHGDFARMS